MANSLVVRKGTSLAERNRALRAAQYVRMSTERQQYSIQNQAAVIATYAHAHNLTIVQTYRDEGESGLQLKNRSIAAGRKGPPLGRSFSIQRLLPTVDIARIHV